MATRRNPTKESITTSPPPDQQPRQPGELEHREAIQLRDLPGYPQQVLWKLIIYSIAVLVLPLSAYFYSVNYVFDGNTTYAGATAAITANLILFSYIVVAMREDKGDQEQLREQQQLRGNKEETKKMK
ncbi:vacuolar ATPase assembly integral membrane protein VMA21 [Coccidioides immitis RS]|uniref:Vacuolar ATPase assembly integral membrane protein VMA21 n=3 Tax=Coccidioides immitis TaxID=5501 RepID=VMA21_COCIM|nr:vacuolar ATPase assembly integral membrane protein VMA21 [Coccidioides immitis RS]Q1DPX9.1 RecName: Full=Vacuolar ATPase assembly integral membrane protein VMA21 [Coccidioides immitis RS]KMP06007.1 hypothetical protein CIRG_05688 [Coccidioides immitis RMSCC 2394]KMU89833.1 hypothetical protein CIHG_07866 [Coccidioides immitis H538.4]TPX22944.1 vacuolar ATPase assembly integral membrane protein vma21 [Coccidioides immitis]EAS28888.1 vacuolar ATPase assembly integral membrane protein VMA21 [C